MNNKSLSQNLIYQRTKKGITQEELSDKSNVAVRTIQRIEKGDVNPHLHTIKLLCEALNISTEDLIEIDKPNKEEISKNWLLVFHASPFLGFLIPFGNVLIPLFLWISKSKDNIIYDKHGKSVFNFHCSLNLYLLISLLLFFPFPGYNYFLTGATILFGIVMTIMNTLSALNTEKCRYYLSIPFLK
jgi:uncharacterized Tic20 family protein